MNRKNETNRSLAKIIIILSIILFVVTVLIESYHPLFNPESNQDSEVSSK